MDTDELSMEMIQLLLQKEKLQQPLTETEMAQLVQHRDQVVDALRTVSDTYRRVNQYLLNHCTEELVVELQAPRMQMRYHPGGPGSRKANIEIECGAIRNVWDQWPMEILANGLKGLRPLLLQAKESMARRATSIQVPLQEFRMSGGVEDLMT